MFTVLACAATTAAPAQANRLHQLPGTAGCIVAAAVADCAQVDAWSTWDVLVAGEHVYVSDTLQDRIRIYDRDPATGALTPRSESISGCIDNEGSPCADARAFLDPKRMALSPDGTTLFVVLEGSKGVAALARNTLTGTLSQPAAQSSCATRTGDGDECVIAASIDIPIGLAVSPDGADLYVAGQDASNNGSVTLLDVAAGLLSPHAPASGGCAENSVVTTGCLDARAMSGGRNVVVSPDGKHVYVTSAFSNAVTGFTRALDGALGTIAGVDGCLQMGTSSAEDCATSPVLGTEVFPLAFADDGRGYVGGVTSGNVTQLSRNPTTGGVTAPGACAAPSGAFDGTCTPLPDSNTFGIVDFELSPDRSAMLVGLRFGRGMWIFTFGPGGAPVPPDVPSGCLATGGINFTTSCAVPRGFARDPFANDKDFGPNGVAFSDDGRYAYAASPQNLEDRAGIVAAHHDVADPSCQNATVSATAGQEVTLPLTCTDPDGDAVTLSIVAPPAAGTIGTVDQGAQTVTYSAPADFEGTETLAFKGTTWGVDSAPATVTIHVSRPAPQEPAPTQTKPTEPAPQTPPPQQAPLQQPPPRDPFPENIPTAETIDQLPDPDPFRETNVEHVSGDVFVRLPAGVARSSQSTPAGFIRLTQAAQIPMGSLLDTSKGRVKLESTFNRAGTQTQTGEFYAGRFQTRQARSSRPVTELVLSGGTFRGCPRPGKADASQRRRRTSRVRRLWGDARGRFRTRGRYSSSAVRGTKWLVEDRCDGTLTRLPRQSRTSRVDVFDIPRRRTVTLLPGQSYLARAR